MKNLWFTFLASLVFCGSSFVFNENKNMTSYLLQEMKRSNFELDKTISFSDMKINQTTSIFPFPEYMEFEESWYKSKAFLSSLSNEVEAPKSKKEASRFYKEWNRVENLFFINFIKNEGGKYEILFSSGGIYIDSEIYYRTESYHSIVNQILKMRLKILEASTGNYFVDRVRVTIDGFCGGGVGVPSNLKLPLNETSEIPMVIDLSCYQDKHNIRSLWINNQLVFNPERYTSWLGKNKFNLVYTGENTHRVKIAFQHLVNAPIIVEERIYDFEINECN